MEPQNFDFGTNIQPGNNNQGKSNRSQLEATLDVESEGTLERSLAKILPIISRIQALTIPAGATSFDVRGNVMEITAAGAVTISRIYNGYNGQVLTLKFMDSNVTITDAAGADTDQSIELQSAFTSSANTVLQLVRDTNSWYEISRSTTLATPVSLANGGTAKALTASNGAVVYSDADSLELTAVGSSGQYLKSNGAAAPSWETFSTTYDLIGDASDGNVTVNSGTFSSGPITNNVLTRDAFFDTLTINNTYSLDTGGYMLFARSVVFVLSGKLTCNGNNGGNGGNGNPGDASNGGEPGGTAGTGGTGRTTGTLYGSEDGKAGGAGGGGGDSVGSSSPGAGTAGANGTNNLVSTAGKAGLVGQTGGPGNPNAGLAGGATAAAGSVSETKQHPRDVDLAKHGGCFLSGTWTPWKGCANNGSPGGGGGGGYGAPGTGAGGSGGGSGGNGSNAGIMVVVCNSLTCSVNNNFEAIGGNGGNGGNGGTGAAGNGGGGSGGNGGNPGNGGIIIIFYHTKSGSISTDVSAGTVGTGGTAGTGGFSGGNNGSNGQAGVTGATYAIQF